MSLNIGVFTLVGDIDYMSVATHIANCIADGDHSVALKESISKEDLFKTAKANFTEDGSFVVNGVHYYPNGYKGDIEEESIITVFGEVNILHEFELIYDRIYLVSTGRIDNKIIIDQYMAEISEDIKNKIELILLGASKEELSVFQKDYRCITITEHHVNVCPYNLFLRFSSIFAEKGIKVPVYHKNWTYEEVTYHYVPEVEKKSLFDKLGFGKKKAKKDNELEEPKIIDETPIVSDIEVHEKKVITKANQFTEGFEFVSVPAPVLRKDPEPEQEMETVSDKKQEVVETVESVSQPVETNKEIEKKNQEVDIVHKVSDEDEEKRKLLERIKQLEAENKEKSIALENVKNTEPDEKPVVATTESVSEQVVESLSVDTSEIDKESKEDLIELARKNEELRYASRHDELTGVMNRKAFEEDIKTYTTYAFIEFDVNDLKVTNDTKGHSAGDKLIVTISKTIESQFENVYRVGGDEFSVIIPNATKNDEANIMKQLLDIDSTLESSTKKDKDGIKYCVAYGLAFSSEGDINTVKDLADKRMYHNKSDKKASKLQKREAVNKDKTSGMFGKFFKREVKAASINKLNAFVTGISHSVGTSYIAGSLAAAITDIYDIEVWFDHKKPCSLPDNYMVREVQDEVDRFNAFKNGVIVQDKGVYEELGITDRTDMMHADLNILVSTAEESDLQKIAQFIETQGDMIQNWLFVFNHVLDHQKRLLEAAMRDYSYIIIDFHDRSDIPEKILSEWKEVIEYFTK